MTAIVTGSIAVGAPSGDVATYEDPALPSPGADDLDSAVGAFSGLNGLPEVNSTENWEAFAAALLAKTSEPYDGGITVTDYAANRFVGVGGGGGDRFEIDNHDVARIDGRGGDDTLTAFGADTADTLDGGDGNDRLSGGGGADSLVGGNGDDILTGGLGDNSLNGGAGFDWISYADAPGRVVVTLYVNTIVRPGSDDEDAATDVEGIIGTAFGDHLAGTIGRNAVLGGGGDDLVLGLEDDDTLSGGAGNDRVWGETGDDLQLGGEGNDLLIGGEGDDTLDGGEGGDTADYRDAAAAVTVSLLGPDPHATGGAGNDTLFGIEALIGSAFRDTLQGDAGANRLDGRGGQDRLHGAAGSDTLVGAAGKDLLDGGIGADRMSGGPGKDRYFYDAPDELEIAQADTIIDLSNEDRILLTSIDAKADKAGDQAFELVAAFTGKSGQAVLAYDAGADMTELRLDMTGDAVADGLIRMLGDHTDFTNFAL